MGPPFFYGEPAPRRLRHRRGWLGYILWGRRQDAARIFAINRKTLSYKIDKSNLRLNL